MALYFARSRLGCYAEKNWLIELLTDIDMLLMFKDGIHGGVAMASNRLGQANNKYMGEGYDSTVINLRSI